MTTKDADASLREHLLWLLDGGDAHMGFEEAVADYPMASANTVFPNGEYTAWHLLEHLRLAQWDILDFIRNPAYQAREWPKDYWPPRDARATEADWRRTIADFQRDLG